jgi:hypothetical protein
VAAILTHHSQSDFPSGVPDRKLPPRSLNVEMINAGNPLVVPNRKQVIAVKIGHFRRQSNRSAWRFWWIEPNQRRAVISNHVVPAERRAANPKLGVSARLQEQRIANASLPHAIRQSIEFFDHRRINQSIFGSRMVCATESSDTLRAVFGGVAERRLEMVVLNERASASDAPESAPLSHKSLNRIGNAASKAVLINSSQWLTWRSVAVPLQVLYFGGH